MESIRSLVEEATGEYGDKTFVYYENEQISFKEMNNMSNQVANAFLQEGIGKGERVAIMLLNRPEFLYTWFGLNKIGASMVPINTAFTPYEAEYLLNHSECKMVVTDTTHFKVIEKARENCPLLSKVILLDSDEKPEEGELFWDFIKGHSTDLEEIEIKLDDEAAILYTSGTTGRPKGCIENQLYYLQIGRMYVRDHQIDSTDRILTPLPLFHMNAQTLSTMGALMSGASLILIDRFHPSTWWQTVRDFKATFFHYLGVVPAILYSMPEREDDYNPTTLYGIGAGVPKDIHEKFEKRFNVELLEVFGSTEGGGGGAFFTGKRLKDRKVGTASFGTVLPEVEAKIFDEEDREVPHGEVGELVTRSSDPTNRRKGYMLGYLKNPEATEEVWKNGWFHTGDYCKRDEEGYFYFVDRKKDMIRRSGENISASEIEGVVRSNPHVADVAAVAVPDEKRIEEVKIYVVKAGDTELSPEEIIEWCEERLAYFKIPRYIEFKKELPKTSTEKVNKSTLKQEKADLTEGAWDRTLHMKLKREKERELDWQNLTIGNALKLASKRWGGKEAVVSKERRETYSELFDQACKLATGLRKLGVKKGDSVATIFGIVPEWIYVKYALHIIGARLVPVNVSFKKREIEYILKKADVKTLITTDKLRYGNYLEILSEIDPDIETGKEKQIKSNVLPALERVVYFSPDKAEYPYGYDLYEVLNSGADYKEEDIDRLLDQVNPDDICNILFTSGSTAFPKGAMHCHKSLLGIGTHIFGKTFRLNSSHRLLCYFPFYHIAGCVYYTLGALSVGCTLYVNEFIPDEILPIIQDEKIDLFCGFDAHFNAISEHPLFQEFDLGSMKFVLLATGPDWYDRCQKIFPKLEIIAHHYGFTEGTGVSIPPDEKDYNVRKFTNGKPWPGIEVKVVDPATGEKVPPKQSGELCLRGWSRFKEYYKAPEETEKAIDSEGFFHSGDYGWMDEKGHVVYRGRYKMMIKTGGENVSEREVEVVLEEMPGIRSVQVIGVPDEKWGEAVTAVIELEEGAHITMEDIVEFCKDRIARFKIPKNILVIKGADWPLLGAGKVDKKNLKDWAISKIG